ncbi:MAG: MarR family transcriptional regulator [Actinomycetia bacterium]|nr:MarR family transcriptional regulator [Actinomycetes bacterium]
MPPTNTRHDLIAALDLAIDAFNRDGRLGRGRATRRARKLTGLDWTYSALLIMEEMRVNPTLRLSQLADLTGTTPPTVTKLIRDLESKGLVHRMPDELDGRVSIVSLTDRGREMATAIRRKRLEALEQVLSEWSVDDFEQFLTLFEQLRDDMQRLSSFIEDSPTPTAVVPTLDIGDA